MDCDTVATDNKTDRHAHQEGLMFHKNFDVKKNNDLATNFMRLQFNTNVANIQNFILKAQYFVLRH